MYRCIGVYMPIGQERRKLDIQRTEGILKDVLPKNQDKAVSIVAYKTGLTKETVREFIQIIKDNDIITKDEENNLIWNKD